MSFITPPIACRSRSDDTEHASVHLDKGRPSSHKYRSCSLYGGGCVFAPMMFIVTGLPPKTEKLPQPMHFRSTVVCIQQVFRCLCGVLEHSFSQKKSAFRRGTQLLVLGGTSTVTVVVWPPNRATVNQSKRPTYCEKPCSRTPQNNETNCRTEPNRKRVVWVVPQLTREPRRDGNYQVWAQKYPVYHILAKGKLTRHIPVPGIYYMYLVWCRRARDSHRRHVLGCTGR